VAVVGRNGSGKSTLLQLVAGILTPSAGQVRVRGRVAALLELGAGFTPEFTGRENVQLNASILGLSAAELEERTPEIIDFADIGPFIDQPVRTYSSGMYVRLAFAVAINVDADVLIVDEALSVGDEAFQRKCFARIRRFQDRGGTLLFVSHSAALVVELAGRAVLLDRGEMLLCGTPKEAVAQYHRLIYAPPAAAATLREALRRGLPAPPDVALEATGPLDAGDEAFYDPHLLPRSTLVYPARGAEIEEACVRTPSGRRVNVLQRRREYVYEYAVRFASAAYNVRCGMLIKTTTGLELGGAVSAQPGGAIPVVEAGSRLIMRFRFRCLLAEGTYFLNAGVLATVDAAETFLHRVVDVAMIRVLPDAQALSTGLVDFEAEPEVVVQAAAPQHATGC
jgi:lipopolysaccharide transport system ATP-binding protein